jgi:hypothetical protein
MRRAGNIYAPSRQYLCAEPALPMRVIAQSTQEINATKFWPICLAKVEL